MLVRRLAVFGVVSLLAGGMVSAIPPIRRESRILLSVRILAASAGTDVVPLARGTLEIPTAASASTELPLDWPDAATPSRIRIDASGTAGPPDGVHEILLDARVMLPDGGVARSSRSLSIREGTARILDVYADRGKRLILAVEAERVDRAVVSSGSAASTPVEFRLEVFRVEGPASIPLDETRMDTFLGQGVEYSFDRGSGTGRESLRLLLTPVRVAGEIAEVSVDITGTLPGNPAPFLVSRTERLVASRGTRSSFTVAAGEFPSGYRFVLTPDF